MSKAPSKAPSDALAQLNRLIEAGQDAQNSAIQRVLNVTIKDKLVDPRAMSFEQSDNHKGVTLKYRPELLDTSEVYRDVQPHEVVRIDDHAMGQLSGIGKIPKLYINALQTDCANMPEVVRLDLLCNVLNTHFNKGAYFDRKGHRTKFLHRIVSGELLGVLSRNYNRKLGTAAMLRPFLEQCAVNGAKPVYAHLNRLQAMLQCVLPIIHEPVKGEHVAFGVTYSNSDFGAGSLTVQGILLRVSSGSSIILNEKFRRIHLGAVISESELALSEETLKRESMTHISAVRDMVNSVFLQENINQALEMVRYSITEDISWAELLRKVRDVLSKGEVTSLEKLLQESGSGVVDLPPVSRDTQGDPTANAWWAAAALGHISTKIDDVARKESIQELAGKMLKSDS